MLQQLRSRLLWMAALVSIACAVACILGQEIQSRQDRPEPPVVDPGSSGRPPSDAIVLFDGRDLSQWEGGEKWIVENGVATVAGGDGITTRQSYGDCQLHLEWAAPEKLEGSGQERGNSGIYLQERYELQVLDSFENRTYPDGQAGALYKQAPPLVNACRRPGEWQSYDIIFTAPRFDSRGKLLRPGYMTVLHNGVLIQNHTEVQGSTANKSAPAYTAHPLKQPLFLQNHRSPVRYRNIWIREL